MNVSMKKILIVLVTLVVLVTFVFSGCASNNTGNTLRVGVDNTYPPMEFTNDKNETVGFDVDLANEIAKKLNKKLVLVPNAWDGIFLALDTDKFDCIISSVSLKADRLENYEFTKPYIANAQVIVVGAATDTIKEPKDLAGKKVGVQLNTTADESTAKYLNEVQFEVTKYDQIIQCFSDLKAGRIDAVVVDEVVARDYVSKDKESYKVTSAKLTNEPIGVCIKKGNTELRDKIQSVIDELKADGTLKKISEKWFGEDLTSNIDEKLRE